MSHIFKYSDLEGNLCDIAIGIDEQQWSRIKKLFFVIITKPKIAETKPEGIGPDEKVVSEEEQLRLVGYELEAKKNRLTSEASTQAYNYARDLLDTKDPEKIKHVLKDWGYDLALGPAALDANEYLEKHIRAKCSLLYLISFEEDRVTRALASIAEANQLGFYSWSFHKGLLDRNHEPLQERIEDPGQVIDWCSERNEDAVFVLKDFHPFLEDPLVVRKVRDLVKSFKGKQRTMIFLSPIGFLPRELERDHLTMTSYPLPQFEELDALLSEMIQAHEAEENYLASEEEKELEFLLKFSLHGERRSQLISGCLGLTLLEAQNLYSKAIVKRRGIFLESIAEIIQEKEQLIKKSGILEFYTSPEKFATIGGLENLKAWLRSRKPTENPWATFSGLPAAKGILLVGVPGCGKSLCAKAVAAEWRMPLLRLDLGRIFGGLVGESEANMRRAIAIAEAAAPCVLWIDEIEKGFSDVWGGSTAVTSRIFGTVLTWMREKTSSVFLVATANDISSLPPEFLSKGRFDEIFFVDLPNKKEREEIFRIHLGKKSRNPDDFPLTDFAKISAGYSGAEIEQVVISALYEAFENNTAMTASYIKSNLKETVPLTVTASGEIERIRRRASEMAARPASSLGN